MVTSRKVIFVGTIAAAMVLAGCTAGGGQADEADAVTIYTGLTGDKGANFDAAIAEFEKESGIDVIHVGVPNVQTDLSTRIQAGDPPDLALFPQPGLIRDFAAQGKVVPLDDILDMDELNDGLVPGLLETAQVDGKTYAVPYDVSVKSLIWYSPSAFDAAGYEIPTTWDEFTALSEDIRDSGTSPFCFSIESGTGTGWPATDWLEDLVLRTAGPDVYDEWVSHDTAFDSPEITEAMEEFQDLLLTDGSTFGGKDTIVTTSWSTGIAPMFDEEPGCYMFHMGSFMATSMPEGVEVGTDVSAFYLPGAFPGGYEGNPVLGGGDMAVILKDSPNAQELMRFLASAEGGTAWAERGGFLSPWTTFDADVYVDDLTRAQAGWLADATTFRFDGSDSMPGAVGSGALFQQLTAWINGSQDITTTLQNVDAAWPAD